MTRHPDPRVGIGAKSTHHKLRSRLRELDYSISTDTVRQDSLGVNLVEIEKSI